MFNQIRLTLKRSVKAFILLLVPSALALALVTNHFSSLLFAAFLLVIGANLIFALRATLTHGITGVQISDDRIQLARSSSSDNAGKLGQTSLEYAEFKESTWISPNWGLVMLTSDTKREFLLLLSPLNVEERADLRRFRVHCSHNQKLKLKILEPLSS